MSKDVLVTGTGSDEEETDEGDTSGMDEEGADEAFDITVKDWCVVIYDGELYLGEVQSQKEMAIRFPPWLSLDGTECIFVDGYPVTQYYNQRSPVNSLRRDLK